jgi:hypothetical protein
MRPTKPECELADAYIEARYWLPEPRLGWALTFSARSPLAGLAPPAQPSGTWAIISAANPWSMMLDDPTNTARTLSLAAELTAGGLISTPMRNCASDGAWEEASYLIEGPSRESVHDLCRRFEQSAAVYGIGDRCGLLWSRTERWVRLPAALIRSSG